jgi:hypothetical protein
MAEERENMKGSQVGSQVGQNDDDDVEGHADVPLLDDTDPEQAKLKLANDEDDDVEGHVIHPNQNP